MVVVVPCWFCMVGGAVGPWLLAIGPLWEVAGFRPWCPRRRASLLRLQNLCRAVERCWVFRESPRRVRAVHHRGEGEGDAGGYAYWNGRPAGSSLSVHFAEQSSSWGKLSWEPNLPKFGHAPRLHHLSTSTSSTA